MGKQTKQSRKTKARKDRQANQRCVEMARRNRKFTAIYRLLRLVGR